jgi:phage shock protein A
MNMTEGNRADNLALIQEAIEPMNGRLDRLEQRMDELAQGQNRLEQRQMRLEVLIENQMDRAIKALSDGHAAIMRKLNENISLEQRVESPEHRMSAVEYVLKKA